MRQQMQASGLGLRQDMSAALTRMAAHMEAANRAMQANNPASAQKFMDSAEKDVDTLKLSPASNLCGEERFMKRRCLALVLAGACASLGFAQQPPAAQKRRVAVMSFGYGTVRSAHRRSSVPMPTLVREFRIW